MDRSIVLAAVILCLFINASAQQVHKQVSTPPVAKPDAIAELPARCKGNALSRAETTRILIEHNRARTAVGLLPVTWDCSLAITAQSWAGKGKPGHNEYTPYGENIFVSSHAGVKVASAVSGWLSEKAGWANNTGTCAPGKFCTHYTQIVWSKTTRIGCGINRKVAGKWKALFVCNYDPAAQSGKAF